MDSTIIQTTKYIRAGIWSKQVGYSDHLSLFNIKHSMQNKFYFQIEDDDSKQIILDHKYAGTHPHLIIVEEVYVCF